MFLLRETASKSNQQVRSTRVYKFSHEWNFNDSCLTTSAPPVQLLATLSFSRH
jgi:hypothetical protein